MKINEGLVCAWQTGLAVVMALAVGSSDVAAAPLDSGALMDTLKKPSAQLPKAPPKIDLEPAVGQSAPASESDVKIQVSAFRISGMTVIPLEQILPLLKPYQGRELTFTELNEAVRQVTNYYRQQGYFVATAYLPPQELTPDAQGAVAVQIAVVEGALGEVHVTGSSGISENWTKKILESSAKDKVLRAKNIERGLLLLDDMPGVDVQSTMKPGKKAGSSDLDVAVSRESLLTGSLDASNYGSEYTGDFRGGLTLNLNSPLHIGDKLTLRGITSEDNMWFGRAGYSLPVSPWGTRLGGYYSQMDYELNGSLSTITGDGKSYGAFVSHPLVRSRIYNLYAQLAWDHKENTQNVSSIMASKYKPDIYSASLTGDLRDGLGGGGLTSYEINYSHIDNNSLPVTYVGLGDDGKVGVSLSRLQRLPGAFSLYVAGSAQISNDDVISSEQFRLGGPNGVRAYPQGEGSGDSGVLMNADLRYDLEWLGKRLGDSSVQAVLFGDVGNVHLNTPVAGTPSNQTLTGVGVGLNLFNMPNQFSVKWNTAMQLGNDRITTEARQGDSRTWIQAVKWF